MKINFQSLNFRANKVSHAQAEYFRKTLKNSKNVDIICHTGTDADSAASAVVIASYLAQMGVKSRIVASKDVAKLGILNLQKYNFIKEEDMPDKKNQNGTTICVDFSSKDRGCEKALNLINSAKKLLCIDHHRGLNLVDCDYTYINAPIKNNSIKTVSSCYVDSSAKSTTSIIYRFLEALGENIEKETAYNLFLGLADDASKRGYLNCDAKKGEIVPSQDAYEDENFMEVYFNLRNKLDEKEIKNIAKKVDRTANLTKEEQTLKDYLYQNIQFSPDKKIAYVAFEPDNKIWQEAGGDTPVVSNILNKFRQDILANKENKEIYKNLEVAMVFYESENNYRVSLHSKNKNLYPVYKYIEQNCPAKNISIGGHSTRGGGRITTTDEESCKLWINQVVEACKQDI